jgi:hypothetical protein
MKEIHQLRHQLTHLLNLYENEVFESQEQKPQLDFSDTLQPPTNEQVRKTFSSVIDLIGINAMN